MNKGWKIALGADHGGFEMKEQIAAFLKAQGHTVLDCGTFSKEAVDYPRFAFAVASQVAGRACDVGIMVDGAGIGSAMTANKVKGVRAAACYNEALARNSREHNGANVLTLGAGQTSMADAQAIITAFLSTELTEERHRRRVQLIDAVEQGTYKPDTPKGGSGTRSADLDLSAQDVEKIANRVKELLSGSGTAPTLAIKLSPQTLAKMIDHTILRPDATKADVEKLCKEAVEHGFFSVCVNSSYAAFAAKLLKGSDVKLCCVVGFPLGAQPPDIKALEARKAIREGAKEIDMVINIGALKSGENDLVLKDIRAVVEACKDGRALCKVILETSFLSDEEKVRACELSMKARADFVKTSTGFSSSGATAEDIALMARTVAPKKLGVKASGGVRSYADAMKMIAAGATRIGSSNSVKMLEEARAHN